MAWGGGFDTDIHRQAIEESVLTLGMLATRI